MKLKGIALITLAFFAPISIFVTDITIFSLAIIWLSEGQFKSKWNKIKSSPWILSLLALLLLYLMGMFWGTNHQGAAWLFQKSALLLILPILYTLNFTQKEMKCSLIAFLSATTLSALIANLINLGWINHLFKYSSFFVKNWQNPAFMNYIDHNIYLAFSLFVTLFLLLCGHTNKKSRVIFSSCGIAEDVAKYYLKKAGFSNFSFESLEKSDFIIMTNRSTNKMENIYSSDNVTNCFDKFKGKDISTVKRNGVILSVIRKINL